MRTKEQRKAWSDARRARAEKDPAMRDRAGHGRLYTYRDLGCRCEKCKAVSADSARSSYWHRRGRVCDSPSCVRCVLGGAPSPTKS